MGTEPAKSSIPQTNTPLGMIELETHMGAEHSNLIPRVNAAADEVGFATNAGTSGSGDLIPQVSTALKANTGTEPASWICRVHNALGRDDANDFSEVVCWKVPDYLRSGGDHFDPKTWRFGLHNRAPDTLHTGGTERFKIQVATALQLTGSRWDKFCEDVVKEEKSHWEAVYGESPHATSYTITDIRCLLALDALFLVIWMQQQGGGMESLSLPLRKVMGSQVMRVRLRDLSRFDLYLIENQIPMVLLERAVGNLRKDYEFIRPWEDEEWRGRNISSCVRWGIFDKPGIALPEWAAILRKRMGKSVTTRERAHVEGGLHTLDEIYRILCGDLHGPHDEFYQSVPPATYLEACGVRIKGKEFMCFEDISFERSCLSIPYFCIDDTTERYLRNLVVHEQLTQLTHGQSKYCARSYMTVMENLMKTPADVDLLVKWGVVEVNIGTHDNVLAMWKNIINQISVPYVTNKVGLTLAEVNKYVGQRRNKLRFEFVKLFCSRPWIVVSVIAATLVTIGTLIQTYVNVIGSNEMQPHFPPH